MTDTDRAINLQGFGSDPEDIWIRIRIKPKIRIQNPDHFVLRLDALVKVL